MIKENTGAHKIVEINNVLALRTGQIIANSVYNTTEKAYVENGLILELTAEGLEDATGTTKNPILHYTEELFTRGEASLNHFALEADEDGNAYPRGLVLNIGDVFTTNNVKDLETAEDGLYVIDAGQLAEGAEVAGQAFFAGKVSTTPNGDKAIEFTYLGLGDAA